MADTLTTARPRARKRRLCKVDATMRQRIEAAIQAMIDTLGRDRSADGGSGG